MKLKLFLPIVAFALALMSCNNNAAVNNNSSNKTEQTAQHDNATTGWDAEYDRIAPEDLPDNVIDLISKQWMLVTAGNKDSFNTMTASWGAVGYIWNRPATFIFIRDTRYTYQFLQREDSYTLSFFSEQYRGALNICGNRSGRDTDKVKDAGLTPIETPSGLMSFGEARMIIECKKMFVQELDYDHLDPSYKKTIMEESYVGETAKHQLLISEITNIWVKK